MKTTIKNLFHQAITTRFIPCTNYRESRVKASAEAGSMTVGWDHALNVDENHAEAARALIAKFGWHGQWVQAAMPGAGYAFSCVKRTKGG